MKYEWTDKKNEFVNEMKKKFCESLILTLPDDVEEFEVYSDISGMGLGCVLTHRGKVISYTS